MESFQCADIWACVQNLATCIFVNKGCIFWSKFGRLEAAGNTKGVFEFHQSSKSLDSVLHIKLHGTCPQCGNACPGRIKFLVALAY